jgi:arylsulfatase|tara:strand:+ start:7193 stop:9433 length:2241 start_codon:yes stop_codon:yes gene_type:complete
VEHSRGFKGSIGRTLKDSSASWSTDEATLAARPNIVMIVLDDVGYAQVGCYGSDIETPVLDGLAAEGLRYANFHVTPLCSPTRVCLLTGRNHHSVGMGRVSEMINGFPNTRGFAAREAANLAEILRPHGYHSMAVGKWHLTAMDDTSPAGPYDHWPLQRGFDRFYGFLAGETNQWNPELILGNERIEVPQDSDYHLSEDLVDRASLWLRQLVSASPDTPFFLYLAFAAAHSPHHVPRPYADKYCGHFDDGWDKARERILKRQKDSGLLPADQQLAPRNPRVQVWDDLDADEKRVAARMEEVFAGFLDHTDVQIGRLLEQIDALGRRDDTLLVALSDNGASEEGGPHGTYDHQRSRNGFATSVAEMQARLDDMGGPLLYNHYPFGWAMAGNTPFKRYKANTHSGGVRAPLILSWRNGIAARGETRRQFYHVVDIAPTILDLVGAEVPQHVNGIEQMPMHGISMRHTLDDDSADTRKETQYFETLGHRAVWHKGWKVVAHHLRGKDFDEPWELYHLDEDMAELNNLAEELPDKLAELEGLWWQEAERFGVLPLDDLSSRSDFGWAASQLSHWVLYQDAVLPHFYPRVPSVRGRSHRITARIERLDTDMSGVLIADGGRFGGWSVFIHDNRLHYTTNSFGDRSRVTSTAAVPTGEVTLQADVIRVDQDEGLVRFYIDDDAAGEGRLTPFRWGNFVNEPLEVGFDSQTPVDEIYQSPFRFGGKIIDVTIDVFGRDVVDPDVLLAELMRSQ